MKNFKLISAFNEKNSVDWLKNGHFWDKKRGLRINRRPR
jgi:hypothetical protein